MKGNIGKAAHALTSTGLSDLGNPDIVELLKNLYPQNRTFINSEFKPGQEIRGVPIEGKDVEAILSNMKRGNATGLDGVAAEELMNVFKRFPDASTFLATILEEIRNNKLPEDLRNALGAQRGFAIKKKNNKPRPIGIPNLFFKILDAHCNNTHKRKLVDICGPGQLGNAISGGCEILIHLLRALTQHERDKLLLQLDVGNAFGTMNRQLIYDAAKSKMPSILPWLDVLFAPGTKVTFFDPKSKSIVVIDVCTGTTQGMPMGGGLHNLASNFIHEIIFAEFPEIIEWGTDYGLVSN